MQLFNSPTSDEIWLRYYADTYFNSWIMTGLKLLTYGIEKLTFSLCLSTNHQCCPSCASVWLTSICTI